jgi:hypothetical protein
VLGRALKNIVNALSRAFFIDDFSSCGLEYRSLITMRLLTFFLCAGALSALAQNELDPSVGPDLRDLMHARNLSMGGAYESLGYGAEAIGGNPAALSLAKRFSGELSGTYDIATQYGVGSVALVDSRTSQVAAGISYHFATFGGSERRWSHISTLALSYPLAPWLHIGVAGRHYFLLGASSTNAVTMNAGVILKPVSFISLGLSGHNLISPLNRDVPRYFVASVSGQFFGQVTPVFDLRLDANGVSARTGFHGGLEWVVAETFPLRIGYEYDGIAGHQFLSGGLGLQVDGTGVDVAYRHELQGDNARMLAATIKIQL